MYLTHPYVNATAIIAIAKYAASIISLPEHMREHMQQPHQMWCHCTKAKLKSLIYNKGLSPKYEILNKCMLQDKDFATAHTKMWHHLTKSTN